MQKKIMSLRFNIRRFFRKWFRIFGYQRRIAPDAFDIIKAHNIDVVLDVGANDGDFGRDLRDSGYNGLIVSFEPNPIVFKRLKKAIAGDHLWSANLLALGEKDCEATLFVAQNDTMSSLKSLTTFGQKTGAKVVNSAMVNVSTLETYLCHNPQLVKNIYLKIDTQGYEMEVLKGALPIISSIKAIQAEISLVHTYTDELDWLAIIGWMRDKQFEVATAICNSAIGAQVREFDFVFINQDFHPSDV